MIRRAPESPAVERRRSVLGRRKPRQQQLGGTMMRQLTRNVGSAATLVETTVADNRYESGTAPGLVAAAQTLYAPGTPSLRRKVKVAKQSWHVESWALRRETPELRFTGDRTARAASRVRLFIGKRDVATPNAEPAPLDVGHALAPYNASMFGDPGRTAQAIRRAAQHLQFNGDTLFVITNYDEQDDEPDRTGHQWQAHSTTELTNLDGRSVPKLNDGANTRNLGDNEMVVRCWIPDPEYFALSDAPTRAILPIARELVGLTKMVSAQIDSRLAGAGLLIVPAGIKPMAQQVTAEAVAVNPVAEDQVDDPELDDLLVRDDLEPRDDDLSFSDQLAEAMILPVENRDSAASLVPFIAELEPDLIQKVQYIRFDQPLDGQAQKLRDEAIRRIALGMDSDPAVLLGMATGNHWSAWAINEDEQKLVVEPLVGTLCHALATGWLAPVCRNLGLDPAEYTVWYDATEMKLRPDRSKDAGELFDAMELSREATLREKGFDPADAPSDAERQQRYAERLILANPALAGQLLPLLGWNLTPEQRAALDAVAAAPTGEAPATGDAPASGPAPNPTEGDRPLPSTKDAPPPEADGAGAAPTGGGPA